MMLEASLLRFGGRGAFLNVLYVRCFAYTVSECGTKHFVTVHTPLSREVFWHEYAKIPRHTSQNSIAAGNLE